MRLDNDLTDAAFLLELGARLRRHRLDRNATQEALAHEAGVSKSTVERLEAGESVQLSNLVRVLRALGLIGRLDQAIPAPLPPPMELLDREGQLRQRASSPGADAPTKPWTWGDEP